MNISKWTQAGSQSIAHDSIFPSRCLMNEERQWEEGCLCVRVYFRRDDYDYLPPPPFLMILTRHANAGQGHVTGKQGGETKTEKVENSTPT